MEARHWWFQARREIIGQLVGALVPANGRHTLVEVGCGTGANVAFFASRYRCVGMDPAEEAIARARDTYPHLTFVRGEAPRELPEWARAADVFLLLDVLEHVSDDAHLLAELVAEARTGTRFVVTVPANPSLWTTHDEAHGHVRRYERRDLERLLAPLPVEIRLLSHFNSRLYPALWAARRFERLIGAAVGPGGTDLWLPPKPLNRLLRGVFRGEADRLLEALRREDGSGYRRGLSLLGIFTK